MENKCECLISAIEICENKAIFVLQKTDGRALDLNICGFHADELLKKGIVKNGEIRPMVSGK